MDIKEIKRQFTEASSAESLSLADVTTNLADWMASRLDILQKEDIALLVSLGSALHSVQMEHNWQRSWDAQ
jgi:hypothetical protein